MTGSVKDMVLTPLAEVLSKDAGNTGSEEVNGKVGDESERGLLDWNFFGVPFLRAAMQIGGAFLSFYLAGDMLRPLSGELQIVALIALLAVGSYIGFLLWKLIGKPLSDFVNDIFPFF